MEILCFFAGTVFAYTESLYSLLALVFALILKAKPQCLLWFFAAFLWALGHQGWMSDKHMPDSSIINNAQIQGTIVSIPVNSNGRSQFQFEIHSLNQVLVKSKVNLSCYNNCPQFTVGQVWQFQVKLKKPENLQNPGSYDFKKKLIANHIGWSGYLKPSQAVLIDNQSNPNILLSVREYLGQQLEKLIQNQQTLGIIQALSLGLTQHIDKDHWNLFRNTGTTHLMVISGAHIALISGSIYWLLLWLWSRSEFLCLYKPAAQAAGFAGILAALLYALLAGFSPPVQRSFIACTLILLSNLLGYKFTGWQGWRYGLLLVLVLEPHTVLLPGFYLSFLAVAILIGTSQRFRYTGFRKNLLLQSACLIGLLPFTLYWFSYGATDGIVANLIAIPLVGYFLVPLSLISVALSCISPKIPFFFSLINFLVESLITYLHWVDNLSFINITFHMPSILILFSLTISIFIIFFMPALALIPSALILLICSFFPFYPRPKIGEAYINVLDVGQGLAIFIATAKHTLIYDTGSKFYQGSDMGKLAIIPYLKIAGVKQINKIIISHPDMDHRGGLTSIEEEFPLEELLVNSPAFYGRGKNCHLYPDWDWDGIHFHFLAIKQNFPGKNNTSCVLKINSDKSSVLLTGDIEKPSEYYLISNNKKELTSDFLVVAHHGSKTSSSNAFIQAVSPRFAIISAGLDNRFHFPHKETLKTLSSYKVKTFNTATCGMVTLQLSKNNHSVEPECFKKYRLQVHFY
jgi:competence protein ComEC